MAFQKYRPSPTATMFNQEWVGLDQFKFLFTGANFGRVLRNTIGMSLINLVLSFITAIGLALLLNEIKNLVIKRQFKLYHTCLFLIMGYCCNNDIPAL